MSKPVDLPCQKVVELVNEYLGDTLSADDRQAFDAHLATCPPCTTYLEQMRTVVNLARSLGKPPTPADVEPQLLAMFRRWQDKGTS
jgi:anti-sigma factor RsiW